MPRPDRIAELVAAVDQLEASDPFSYADPESLMVIERQRSRLQCVAARAVASFDASGEWAADEAHDTAAWLTTRFHLPISEARAQVRRGRALADMPLAAAAWSAGSIGTAQFDALDRSRRVTSPADFARCEELLVEGAQELKFAHLLRSLSHWERRVDPEGAYEADLARRARRDVTLVQLEDGMFSGRITLDPISGANVSGELTRLERLLFEGDWAEAKTRLGREPKVGELWRTSAKRRADALDEMATRSKSTPKDAQRPVPLFTVVVGFEALHQEICQLEGGGVVCPRSLLAHMTSADFERIVFRPGRRVECSVTSRFFTGATRRAIEIRDLECTHAYCEEPYERCQIDHIVPYSEGGLTNQENGQLQCPPHNRGRYTRPPPGG
jgi:hypothetical protein